MTPPGGRSDDAAPQDRHDRLEYPYEKARHLPEGQRSAFLDEHCADDPSLRAELESLLADATEAEAFMEALGRVGEPHQSTGEIVERLNAALEGRYRVVEELGQGGMATVWLADDLRHDRKVALKVLKPELAAMIGAERFLAEIRTTARLQHPHILPLHDSGEADGLLFFVTPYVEGESLRQRLERERQLPVDVAIRIATEVADALDYAHRQGVIHRDVKPGNILLHDGRALVADFGIALAVGAAGGDRLTETGLSLGTPSYMSPEQATGEQHVGPATDIYALGCVLYEMFAGDPPHAGRTAHVVLGRILTEPARSVRHQRPSVPPNVDAAVRTALEKLPADRFGTASRFADALADPSYAPVDPPNASPDGAPPPRRLGLLMSILALTVIAYWVGSAATTGTAPDERVVRFPIDLPPGDRLPVLAGLPISVAVSPDGSRIVYSARRGGVDHLYSRLLDELTASPIPGTEGGIGPFFSPDGRWLGFFADGALKKVALSGGSPSVVAEVANPLRGSWGDDGRIAYASWSSPIMVVSDDGGTPHALTRLDEERGEESHRSPHVLPGARAILFETGSVSRPRIELQDLHTGERHVILEGGDPHFTRSGHLVFARGLTVLAAPFDPESLQLGAPVQLADSVRRVQRTHFAVSSGGTLVHAASASPPLGRLVWVDREGNWRSVTEERPSISHPRVSPDGRRIVFSAPNGFVIRDQVRGTEDLVRGGRPIWAADGRGITYRSDEGLFTVSPSGGQPEAILEQQGFELFPLDWSADGQVLAYSAVDRINSRNVWMLGPNDEPTPYLNTSLDERSASLSAGGDWVAFSIIETGRPERVYVDRYPNAGQRTLVSQSAAEPVWSPTGRELFYRSIDGRELWRVPFDPDSGRLGEAELLFEGPYQSSPSGFWSEYDVSNEGESFLMIRLDEAEHTDRLVVVLNATSH